MENEERDEMITSTHVNVGYLRAASEDQETRLRDLESFKGQTKGVLGTLMVLKVWVLATIFGSAQ